MADSSNTNSNTKFVGRLDLNATFGDPGFIASPEPRIFDPDFAVWCNKNSKTATIQSVITFNCHRAGRMALASESDPMDYTVAFHTKSQKQVKIDEKMSFQVERDALGDEYKFVAAIAQSFKPCCVALADLVAAHCKKGLTTKRIDAFFKHSQIDVNSDEIMAIIRWVSSHINLADADVSALRAKLPWAQYHTTVSATAGLCHKFLVGVGKRFPFHTDALVIVDKAVKFAYVPRSHEEIPHGIIIHTYAYLLALDELPDNWKYGERIVASASTTYVRGLTKMYENILDSLENSSTFVKVDDLEKYWTAVSADSHLVSLSPDEREEVDPNKNI